MTEEAYIIIFHIVFRLSLVSSLGQVVEVVLAQVVEVVLAQAVEVALAQVVAVV